MKKYMFLFLAIIGFIHGQSSQMIEISPSLIETIKTDSDSIFDSEKYSETAAWEYEDLFTNHSKIKYETNLFKLSAFKLIGVYQSKISTHSVQRCPFYLTCSNYAIQAIENHSFIVGLAFFIDRNLYRENPHMTLYYPLRENKQSELKLDDRFYLYGD